MNKRKVRTNSLTALRARHIAIDEQLAEFAEIWQTLGPGHKDSLLRVARAYAEQEQRERDGIVV